jgi:prolyl oligopeptidase
MEHNDKSFRRWGTTLALAFSISIASSANTQELIEEDPFLWLEDVTGDRPLDWARDWNTRSTAELESAPGFEELRERFLSILNSKERIPYVGKSGPHFYNFWQDEKHARGVWRRTSLEQYRKAQPDWETVLDLDQLAADENENWVWKGANFLHPGDERCLVFLSRGGADATVVREFDLKKNDFVEGGFFLPEAKNRVDWRDLDTLYVGTDFGDGSLTDSGYARLIKQWQRGSPLEEARLVFVGEQADVSVGASVRHDPGGRRYEMIHRADTFFTNQIYVRDGDEWKKIEKPDDVVVSTFGNHLLFRLRKDWDLNGTIHPAGTLLAADCDQWLEGERQVDILFQPEERRSLSGISRTRHFLLLNELNNVRHQIFALEYRNDKWVRARLEAPEIGRVSISGVDPHENDQYFLTAEDYVTPSTLFLGTVKQPGREALKSMPAFFDAEGLVVEQQEAVSADGTRIPYFQVSRQGLKLDGENPTLLYGYGGFEIPMLPRYIATIGAGWLERGGVYVVANIRGGGEFGPRWHQAALKENRQRAYDDFIAVAEELIARKVTSPARLGIQGGSNGGLLVGAMLTQRPDLFGAVVCQVPLLDMKRFNKLLAGASWMGEFGNPDLTEEWEYIRQYSPYQNVFPGRKYPRAFFTTSTRDDRVHPAHARKMVAKMHEQGHDILYYENIEGGHGGAANNKQIAYINALIQVFLRNELGLNARRATE